MLFAAALGFIAYLDRACISQAAPMIVKDLHLTSLQMGYVFSAFGLSYAAFEIPSGWLLDRIGPRLVLTRVVLCWSFFTAATGWSWSFGSLFLTRLLFGAGEAGCFPGLAKVFSTWIPRRERPMAEGLKSTTTRWGAAAAPSLAASLYLAFGWRNIFYMFGVIGVVWAALFYRWYRDNPRDHPRVNLAERNLIELDTSHQAGHTESTPWRAFLGSGSAWALCLQWFCHYYGFYFYVTWLPTYLQQARGMKLQQGALLAGIPMLFAGFGALFAGWILGRLTQRMGPSRARRTLAYVAYGGAAAFLLIFTLIENPFAAMLVMGLSSFIIELSTPISWISAMDLGGRSVGVLAGAMNSLGHLGGSVAPTVIGYLLLASGNNWTLTFYASALLYAAGGLCWVFLDPVTPIDRKNK